MQFRLFFSVIHAKLQQSQTVAAVLPSCQVGLKLILTIFLLVKVLCLPLKSQPTFKNSKHFRKKIFFHFLDYYPRLMQFMKSSFKWMILMLFNPWFQLSTLFINNVQNAILSNIEQTQTTFANGERILTCSAIRYQTQVPIFGFKQTLDIKPSSTKMYCY